MENNRFKRIQSPQEVKVLNFSELGRLAETIRQDIIHHTSINGGHIGASLSCVDFIIALHKVFDTPKDCFIFDVGHQAYTHKMLTGRRFQFDKIRKEGGPSGFTNRFESEHDIFGAGHASTSISAALGILEGKRHQKEPGHVVAIIGDGALTGGLSFEGFNHLGDLKRNLIVIFNDNGMSIDENVGALKNTQIENYFRVLGLDYWGPFDGHDIESCVLHMREAKRHNKPIVIHLKTIKGHGFEPAIQDKARFHGCGPFDKISGQAVKKPDAQKKFQDIFAETLCDLADYDPKILAITAGMPSGTSLIKFKTRHPRNFYDVGIAEAHGTLFAAGLATQGVKPFVCIYSTFLQRAYDQLIHDIGIQNLPVRIVMDRGGLVGDDGATHQGIFDYVYLRCLPNFVIMAPKDEVELCHMLETMRQYNRGPITVRFPRGESYGFDLPQKLQSLPIGKAEFLYGNPKGDVLILAVGNPVHDALRAAQKLEKEEGLNVTVINLRFIKPLDEELIVKLAPEFKVVLTVEEGVVQGGMGSAILETLMRNEIHKPVKVLGVPDRFFEHASQTKQRQIAGIDAESIYGSALEMYEKWHNQVRPVLELRTATRSRNL